MDQLKTGTTTVGVVYKDGVVLAADKRVSAGSLVINRTIEKVLRLSERAGVTTAGSVADVQAIIRIMKAEISLHEVRSGSKMNIQSIAGLFSTLMFNNRMAFIESAFILGGFDTKPSLFILDTFGSQIADNFTSIGSGSIIAFGVLETGYKENMTEEEAVKLAHKAVSTSIKRDVFTGEGVDVAIINKKGYKKLPEQEIKKIIAAE